MPKNYALLKNNLLYLQCLNCKYDYKSHPNTFG